MGTPPSNPWLMNDWPRTKIARLAEQTLRCSTTSPTKKSDDPLHADRRNFYKVEKVVKLGLLGPRTILLGADLRYAFNIILK